MTSYAQLRTAVTREAPVKMTVEDFAHVRRGETTRLSSGGEKWVSMFQSCMAAVRFGDGTVVVVDLWSGNRQDWSDDQIIAEARTVL